MEKFKNYYKEQECLDTFLRLGKVFNACTPENHPIIFRTESDFKAGMTILGLCKKLFPKVRIFAFELMTNHLHLVLSGNEEEIEKFFHFFKDRLQKYFGFEIDLKDFNLKIIPIKDLQYFRNALVYTNRNGFVVNDNVTPFSYPWGTNQFFYNPLARKYAIENSKPLGVKNLREIIHKRDIDHLKDILTIDGYVSPLEFCDIDTSEQVFRDAKQYFYSISRNVEAYSEIANSLGEYVFYNDNDIYIAATRISKKQFDTTDFQTISAKDKIDLAKRLHFEYNANEKQLQRLLKIDKEILKAIH